MTKIRVLVKNSDVIIPREMLRRAGIYSGDIISISTVSAEMPEITSPEKRINDIRDLWGLWTDEDEKRFRDEREAMWQSWRLEEQ